MSDVNSDILFEIYLASDEVQAYSSKIIQYFQLHNHEYCPPSLRLFIHTHNVILNLAF